MQLCNQFYIDFHIAFLFIIIFDDILIHGTVFLPTHVHSQWELCTAANSHRTIVAFKGSLTSMSDLINRSVHFIFWHLIYEHDTNDGITSAWKFARYSESYRHAECWCVCYACVTIGQHPPNITTWQLWLAAQKDGCKLYVGVCVCVRERECKINHEGNHPWPMFP